MATPATHQSPAAGVARWSGGAAASSTTAGGGGGGGTAFLCLATCFARSGEGFVSRGEAGGDGGVTFGAGSSDGDDEGSEGDDAGDAKRAKRGADERPPAPVEPQPGVGGSLGGDGEAAAVGMDGTGNRELGGVASE